jgi:hypothetical protein
VRQTETIIKSQEQRINTHELLLLLLLLLQIKEQGSIISQQNIFIYEALQAQAE